MLRFVADQIVRVNLKLVDHLTLLELAANPDPKLLLVLRVVKPGFLPRVFGQLKRRVDGQGVGNHLLRHHHVLRRVERIRELLHLGAVDGVELPTVHFIIDHFADLLACVGRQVFESRVFSGLGLPCVD